MHKAFDDQDLGLHGSPGHLHLLARSVLHRDSRRPGGDSFEGKHCSSKLNNQITELRDCRAYSVRAESTEGGVERGKLSVVGGQQVSVLAIDRMDLFDAPQSKVNRGERIAVCGLAYVKYAGFTCILGRLPLRPPLGK